MTPPPSSLLLILVLIVGGCLWPTYRKSFVELPPSCRPFDYSVSRDMARNNYFPHWLSCDDIAKTCKMCNYIIEEVWEPIR